MTSFELRAEDCAEECVVVEEVDTACVIKFKKNNYENSTIVNPIEIDFPVKHPSSHESSFYEFMTH